MNIHFISPKTLNRILGWSSFVILCILATIVTCPEIARRIFSSSQQQSYPSTDSSNQQLIEMRSRLEKFAEGVFSRTEEIHLIDELEKFTTGVDAKTSAEMLGVPYWSSDKEEPGLYWLNLMRTLSDARRSAGLEVAIVALSDKLVKEKRKATPEELATVKVNLLSLKHSLTPSSPSLVQLTLQSTIRVMMLE